MSLLRRIPCLSTATCWWAEIPHKLPKQIYISNKLGVYSSNIGGFSNSGWQSRFINFTNNAIVQWLPTRAVIYRSEKVKKIRLQLF